MSVHHANLYRTNDPLGLLTTLKEQLSKTDEVQLLERERWGIDDSRVLVQEAYRTTRSDRKRSLLITFVSATTEAQNALLKILEEPPGDTTFHFILSSSCYLLPTLESRFFEHQQSRSAVEQLEFAAFAQKSLSERLALIDKKLKAKDASWIESMRQGLLAYVSARPTGEVLQQPDLWLLITQHLGGRGASNKMLLEALALLLPKTE